jgi:hypothetical protein
MTPLTFAFVVEQVDVIFMAMHDQSITVQFHLLLVPAIFPF